MRERVVGLAGLIAVALVLIIGTFTLLALGRVVPEPVWVAWGVVITALFGHGVFLAQAQSHQAVRGDLLSAFTLGAGTQTGSQNGGATNGRPAGGAETSSPAPAAPPANPTVSEVTTHGL